MKWFSKVLMVALMVFGGCANEGTTDTAISVGEKMRITIGLPATRLQLGEKVGESYPLNWSEVDYIYANNTPSSRIIIDKENPSRFSGPMGALGAVMPTVSPCFKNLG